MPPRPQRRGTQIPTKHRRIKKETTMSVTTRISPAMSTNGRSNGHTDLTELFGSNVFTDRVMKKRLPKDVYQALRKTIETGVALGPKVADGVAKAMKEWAIEKGATHYTHW